MKKAFIGLLSLACVFSLASCKGKNNDIVDNDDTTNEKYPSDQVVDNNTGGSTSTSETTLTPVYKTPKIDYSLSSETSKETNAEATVEKIYDSVVSITASSVSAASAGSGVLFGSDNDLGISYIATCFHVIEDASKFEVTLSDDTTYTASLVGGYDDLDLAVLSIEKTGLTYADIFSDSDSLKLGSSVVCIGNPLGTLPGSVSSGVISYVNRKIKTDSYTTRTLIQTDVAINSGNSGGGLFNTAGVLIGIVNAKYSSSEIEGLGFAIPANQVVNTIKDFLTTAQYDTANKVWSYGYVNGDYQFGFTITGGYYTTGYGWNSNRTYVNYVSAVSTNSTATGYGKLQVNDIITAVAVDYADESKSDKSLTVTQSSDVMGWLYEAGVSINDTITFTITRNSQSTTVSVPVTQYIYSI